MTANLATTLLVVDLLLALAVCTVWMVIDAKRRGVSIMPFVLLTCLTGSAGPIAYLIHREWTREPVAATA